jgi:hypothetical protein
MKKNLFITSFLVATFLLFSWTQTASATPYRVTVDVSSVAGTDFELEFDLFDRDGTGVPGLPDPNSWLLIDNVFISDANGTITPPGLIDFEGGPSDFGGFDVSLNPGSVSNVPGAFPCDPGSRLLRVDEDPIFSPSIIYRGFLNQTATTLGFDFEFNTTSSVDSVVVSLYLSPFTGAPLLSTGVLGPGDPAVLEATISGNSLSSDTDATPIPEPTTILLMGFGLLGLLGIVARQRRKGK